jgi:hypothetical protein
MSRHPHHIAEMMIQAENRVRNHGQPYMLPMHGGTQKLQGYSNPYDYPSTLGAGMSGGAIISQEPYMTAPRTRGGAKMPMALLHSAQAKAQQHKQGGIIPMSLMPLIASNNQKKKGGALEVSSLHPRVAQIRARRAKRVEQMLHPEIAGGKVPNWLKKVGDVAKSAVSNKAVRNAAMGALVAFQPELAPAVMAAKAMGAGRRPRGRPRKCDMDGGKVPNWLKKVGDVAKKVVTNPIVKNAAMGALVAFQPELAPAVMAAKAMGAGRRPRGRPRKHATGGKISWGSIGRSLGNVASSVGNAATSAVSAIASNPAVQRAAQQAADKAVQAAVNSATTYVTGSGRSGGRGKAKLPTSGRKRNTARGDIVRAIMIQRGVNLPTASRIVKEEGLY